MTFTYVNSLGKTALLIPSHFSDQEGFVVCWEQPSNRKVTVHASLITSHLSDVELEIHRQKVLTDLRNNQEIPHT